MRIVVEAQEDERAAESLWQAWKHRRAANLLHVDDKARIDDAFGLLKDQGLVHEPPFECARIHTMDPGKAISFTVVGVSQDKLGGLVTIETAEQLCDLLCDELGKPIHHRHAPSNPTSVTVNDVLDPDPDPDEELARIGQTRDVIEDAIVQSIHDGSIDRLAEAIGLAPQTINRIHSEHLKRLLTPGSVMEEMGPLDPRSHPMHPKTHACEHDVPVTDNCQECSDDLQASIDRASSTSLDPRAEMEPPIEVP